MITIGIDAHKRTHTMVAVDSTGAVLDKKTVAVLSRATPRLSGGQPALPTSCCGPSRTAGPTPGYSNTIFCGRTSEWCACPR
jgi:hypothetical protein